MTTAVHTFSIHILSIHTIIKCIRKVFRPLHFFHILLHYSLILKCIKSFFPLINLHTIPHNDKAKLHKHSDPLLSTLLKHLWQRLQPQVFLGMMLQAWHTILLCRSSQALSGWIGSVAAQLFSGLSRDVQMGSSPDSGWATEGQGDLSRSHSYVVLAVCLELLSCWKVNLRPSLRS